MAEQIVAARWMEKREWMDVGGCEWMDGWSEVGYLVDKKDRILWCDGCGFWAGVDLGGVGVMGVYLELEFG